MAVPDGCAQGIDGEAPAGEKCHDGFLECVEALNRGYRAALGISFSWPNRSVHAEWRLAHHSSAVCMIGEVEVRIRELGSVRTNSRE